MIKRQPNILGALIGITDVVRPKSVMAAIADTVARDLLSLPPPLHFSISSC